MEVYNALRKGTSERSRLIREFIDDKLADIRKLGIAGPHIDDNTIRWWLVPALIDYLIEKTVKEKNVFEPPKRANGESWGFVGYEITDLPEKTTMGQNGCGNDENMFWAYKYGDYSLWNQYGEPEDVEDTLLMCGCIRTNRLTTSFTDIEKGVWDRINGKYAHASDNGEMIPDIIVLSTDNLEKIDQLIREHRNYGQLVQNMTDSYENVEKIFKKYSHKVLHESLGYNIRMELYAMRMMAVHDLVDNGFLILPENTRTSSLGMYIILK